MVNNAYYYGLTPLEVRELTLVEMADFVTQRRKYEVKMKKLIAQSGYVAGIVGSMSLAKSRPEFEKFFAFPDVDEKTSDLEKSKQQMLAWAISANRQARGNNKGGTV